MKQIIHITDPHVGYADMAQRFTILVEQIIHTYIEPKNYIIVFTGDIIENPEHDPHYHHIAEPIAELRQAGFHLLFCPGNHDYGPGHHGDKRQIARFKQTFLGDATISYPTRAIFDFGQSGQSLAFIGLDSMAEELNWDSSTALAGELGDLQLARLNDMLHEQDILHVDHLIVYLHHHPFGEPQKYTLKDADKLANILRNAPKPVDLLLFGHKHEGKAWHGQWGIPRVYDGGAVTFKDGAAGPFRVIDLSNQSPELDEQQDFSRRYVERIQLLGIIV